METQARAQEELIIKVVHTIFPSLVPTKERAHEALLDKHFEIYKDRKCKLVYNITNKGSITLYTEM